VNSAKGGYIKNISMLKNYIPLAVYSKIMLSSGRN